MNAEEFVVGITSHKKRFCSLLKSLEGIERQTVLPFEVHLNIALDDWPLPLNIFKDFKFRLTINLGEDIGPAKKLLPTLLREKKRKIIVIDDDLIFENDLFESLLEFSRDEPSRIIAARTHLIRRNPSGEFLPYLEWQHDFDGHAVDDRDLFPTSGSGMLIPPGFFDENIFDTKTYRKLSFYTDDLWYFWHMRMAGKFCKRLPGHRRLTYIPGTQTGGLWLTGNRKRNDENIHNLHANLADMVDFDIRPSY